MFERFTTEARNVVAGAQDEAGALRNPFIGPDHLLLSMVTRDSIGGGLLQSRGLDAITVRDRLRDGDGPDNRLDSEALATLGIDLDAVRQVAEAQFGPGALAPNARPMPHGHIPFSPAAKKVLELAVREATAGNSSSINSGHLLLGLLAGGSVGRLVVAAGIDVDELGHQTRIAAAQQAA